MYYFYYNSFLDVLIISRVFFFIRENNRAKHWDFELNKGSVIY